MEPLYALRQQRRTQLLEHPCISHSLSGQLTALSLGTHYAAVWDWLWGATAQCYKGPGLNQCNTGQWRVQSFTITATYAYSQSAYYAYTQSAYYAYSQSAYHVYSQSSYSSYTYSQSAYTSSCTGACYYISASGSDLNSGTSKSAPWLHAPGMNGCSGNCASHTPVAGAQFIFRGCDTWTFTGQFNIATSGSSGNPISYGGLDQTWYNSSTCPSAWSRLIFSGGSAWPGGSPAAFVEMGSHSWVNIEWIEVRDAFVSGGGTAKYFASLTLKSETGLWEEYQFSNPERLVQFLKAFNGFVSSFPRFIV